MYSDKASSTSSLSELLSVLSLSQWLPKFQEAGIDLETLDELDDDELVEMFETVVKLSFGPKKKLQKALFARRNKWGGSHQGYVDLNSDSKTQFNGKYMKVKVLGAGNFGEAHLVTDLTGKQLVLKTQVCKDLQAENKAQQEAVALAQVPANPHLLAVKDFFFHVTPDKSKLFCIVVNYCSGGTVEGIIKKGDRSVAACLRVVLHVAKGLAVLHQAGIVHRDIKPDNLLCENDTVVIGDMGLARSVDENQYYAGAFGHLLYKAPEVVHGQRFSPEADLWSLGVVALEMMSGKTMDGRHKENGFIIGALDSTKLEDFVEQVLQDANATGLVAKIVPHLLTKNHKSRLTAQQVVSMIEP
jgi:serine/threonine protein kinase